MRKWSHLANAPHIDWVLKSINQDPKVWYESWLEVDHEIWHESWAVARDIVKQDPDRLAVWDAVYDATRKDQTAIQNAALSAIFALMAWDDLDYYLSMNYEHLKFVAVLSGRPEAVLLVPMSYVRERIHAESQSGKQSRKKVD